MVQLDETELAALRRFDECAQDGEGYDVPKEMMQRLAEIGLVRRQFGAHYIATTFGTAVLSGRVDKAVSCSSSSEQDAARYRWLRDRSEPGICSFYLSVGHAFKNVKFAPETVDEAIDAAIQSATNIKKAA